MTGEELDDDDFRSAARLKLINEATRISRYCCVLHTDCAVSALEALSSHGGINLPGTQVDLR